MDQKKSTVEGHRRALQIRENPEARVQVSSVLRGFWWGSSMWNGAIFGVVTWWVCVLMCGCSFVN